MIEGSIVISVYAHEATVYSDNVQLTDTSHSLADPRQFSAI